MQSNEDNYWKIATRQMGMVTRQEQEKFKNAKITVIGCGGIGGETIEMLARMGIGELVLVDEDSFDITNLNRQNFANSSTLNQDKSRVACENVRLINPHVKVTAISEHVSDDNIDEIIGDSNIVIDALDNILTRIFVSRKAREKKIPFIHGAIHGTLGQITVFLANTPSYEQMFNLPSNERPLTKEVIEEIENMTSGVPPAIGPTPNLIGCLQAMEAYKIITGIGKVNVAPKPLTFDLLDFASFSINEL